MKWRADELAIEPDRLEDLGAAIAAQRRDPHLREDLEQPLVRGLEVVLDGLLVAEVLGDEGPLLDELRDRLEGEVGIDRAGAVADQEREVRDLARLAGLDDDAAAGAGALADQMVVNRAGREQRPGAEPAPATRRDR